MDGVVVLCATDLKSFRFRSYQELVDSESNGNALPIILCHSPIARVFPFSYFPLFFLETPDTTIPYAGTITVKLFHIIAKVVTYAQPMWRICHVVPWTILLFLLSSAFVFVHNFAEEKSPFAFQNKSNPQSQRRRLLKISSAGDPSCPCLVQHDDVMSPLSVNLVNSDKNKTRNLSHYGLGCAYHDLSTKPCTDPCHGNEIDCHQTRKWCNHAWCHIDPQNCLLKHTKSKWFPPSQRHYSYATCGYHDESSYSWNTLRNTTIKVGFNSNTGGWTGSYSDNRTQFKGPLERWSGPHVEVIKAAAKIGGFQIAVTEIEPFLVNKSISFFGSSSFDLCIYATSLGFLDLCVASYAYTGMRASVTDWIILESIDLYLITKQPTETELKWNRFRSNVITIFQPFQTTTWMFVIFLVTPMFGVLMVFHERGKPGSAYRMKETIIESIRGCDSEHEIKERRIPFAEQFGESVYTSFFAILRTRWEQRVVSIGGSLNLLGIGFFVFTFIAACKLPFDVTALVNSLQVQPNDIVPI